MYAEENRLEKLSEMGDPLEKIKKTINFEVFRPILKEAFEKENEAKGRPGYDYVLMFKILLLQSWYNISDDKAEYIINDRLSFQRFLGLRLYSNVPDAKTIWLYREKLKESGVYGELFGLFSEMMEEEKVITRRGSLIDATFVEVPKQRNTREENKQIKAGEVPEEWLEETAGAKHKLSQKDVDARWTKKNNETHYGYKDHVKVDRDSKLIVTFEVTDAAVHDSQKLVDLIDEKDNEVHADGAYVGEDLHKSVLDKNPKVELKINEKGYRNNPLTEEQKASNKEKSSVRSRVEHVFGHMTNSMGGLFIRCIGIERARCAIAFKNLAYNISRYCFLKNAKKNVISV